MNHLLVPILLALFFAPGGDPAQPTEKDFLADFKKARTLISKGSWETANQQLTTLLEEHANRNYVRVKRLELVECLKTCAFWSAHGKLDPASLISGDLQRYRARSGDIKVVYQADGLSDFYVAGVECPLAEEQSLFIHPALFSGPYTIEVKGSRFPARPAADQDSPPPAVHVCCADEQGYYVVFGNESEKRGGVVRASPAYIGLWKNGELAGLACKADSPVRAGRSFKLKIKVSRDEITAYYSGRKIMTGKIPEGQYGQVGFSHLPFDEFIMQGRVEPAWLQGLQDATIQAAREKFDETFDENDCLPEWLREGEESESLWDRILNWGEAVKDLPGKPVQGQLHHINKAAGFLDDEKFKEGLAYTQEWTLEEVSREVKTFFLALFYKLNFQFEEALESCNSLCELAPEFMEGQILKAFILLNLGSKQEAVDLGRGLVKAHADQVEYYALLAMLLVRVDQANEAKTLVDGAIRRGLDPGKLKDINRLLIKAQNGPVWNKPYHLTSDHYDIYSNIDRSICLEARTLLEEAYQAYTYQLGKVRSVGREKFRVYLFAGEAGYKAYLDNLEEGLGEGSAGVFIPSLKQLLIWNSPIREQMMQTIRHEGFHQYLDRAMPDPPIWLNEGLAGYYECAERKNGKWNFGAPHPVHTEDASGLRQLAPFLDLEKFLFLSPGEFMGNAGINYMLSWAFVHFLRHSTEENRALFEDLIEKLCGDRPARIVLKEVFGGVDLDRLETDFLLYLKRF